MGRLITCITSTNNSGAVPQRADYERTGWLEVIFTDMNSTEHNRVFHSYAASTQMNAYHHHKKEDNTLAQQIMGLMLGQICQMVDRAVTQEVICLRLRS